MLGLVGLQGASLGLGSSSMPPALESSISIGNITTVNVSNVALPGPGSHFWGISVEGGNPNPDMPSLKGFLNAAPFTVLRYGAGWVDEENWSAGCIYNDTSVCYPVHNNVTDYAQLCLSSSRYYCILGVPAEINSVSTLAYEVNWLQSTTGWQPNCWAIGNEPEAWNHFNIPWASWKASDNRKPTASQFAQVALNYTDTLRSIDPGACIIGLESNDPLANIESFTNAVTSAVPNDTAVSFHSYPDGKCTLDGKTGTTAPLSQLLSPSNLTLTQALYNASVANDVSGVPVYIQEFNMGAAHVPTSCGPWVNSYTDSVFTSAVVAQALTYGDPQLTFFHFDCQTPDCLVNSTTGIPYPTYWLYTDLLSQMDLEQLHQVNFTAGGNAHMFAVLGENGTHDRTLLLSNAQPRGWLNLSVSSLVPSAPNDWEMQTVAQNWSAGCASTGCVTTSGPYNVSSGPTYIKIRNQSTVLVHFWNHLPFSANVSFSESGLPVGTTWSVQVSGQPTTTATVSISSGTDQTVNLDDGSYTFSAIDSNSSWAPPTSFPSIFVDGTPEAQSIVFTLVSFPVTFTKTGLLTSAETDWSVTFNGTTMTGPTMTGNPLIFAPVPNGTYAYSIADVPGFHQTTLPYSGTLTVDGAALAESIAFTPVEYTVTVSESGLPSGLSWSVTINGTTMSRTTDGGTDTFTWTGLANNTSYPYSVADNSGWHQTTLPYSGSIAVNGGTGTIDGTGIGYANTLVYTAVDYQVALNESTLPAGLTWQIEVRGVTEQLTTFGGTNTLSWTGLANGTYSYSITELSGWQQGTLPYTGTLTVTGGTAPIDGTGIGYVNTLVYGQVDTVTFNEKGLPPGTTWSASVAGDPLSSSGTAITFPAADGTYSYTIGMVPGYHPAKVSGSVTVTGVAVLVNVSFSLTTYTVKFTETGLASGTSWSVTYNGVTQSAVKASISVTKVVNGTYSYTITPNAGYQTTSYAGSVTVAGGGQGTVANTVKVPWTVVKYAVKFAETGLPHSTKWTVTVDGVTKSSTGTTMSFNLPNGTYSFTIKASGYSESSKPTDPLVVNGASESATVTFTASASPAAVVGVRRPG
ncbi:MAG: hypothetical protein WCB18_09365 [Thermoplasmata archaeon]